MTEDKAIGTLEEMTKESFTNRPQQAPNAIEEYLFNFSKVNESKAKSIEAKLTKDGKYNEQFKLAITHTSLMIVLMSLKAGNMADAALSSEEMKHVLNEIQVDYDKYVREFLMYARQDDKDIYDMRLFYLSNLTSDELELSNVNQSDYESKTEFDHAVKRAKLLATKYDELLKSLQKQYVESKLHLQ